MSTETTVPAGVRDRLPREFILVELVSSGLSDDFKSGCGDGRVFLHCEKTIVTSHIVEIVCSSLTVGVSSTSHFQLNPKIEFGILPKELRTGLVSVALHMTRSTVLVTGFTEIAFFILIPVRILTVYENSTFITPMEIILRTMLTDHISVSRLFHRTTMNPSFTPLAIRSRTFPARFTPLLLYSPPRGIVIANYTKIISMNKFTTVVTFTIIFPARFTEGDFIITTITFNVCPTVITGVEIVHTVGAEVMPRINGFRCEVDVDHFPAAMTFHLLCFLLLHVVFSFVKVVVESVDVFVHVVFHSLFPFV
jgi:hypothetical protein